MICEIVRDESFLAQKSAEASFLDMPIAQNLLDTLAAYSDSCVGLLIPQWSAAYGAL